MGRTVFPATGWPIWLAVWLFVAVFLAGGVSAQAESAAPVRPAEPVLPRSEGPVLPRSEGPVLEVTIGERTVTFTRAALLARPDVVGVAIAWDVAYGIPMYYQAVPLLALLEGMTVSAGQVLEVQATDGFSATLRSDLVFGNAVQRSVPYLAIEPSDLPWPLLPEKTVSAGPFSIVWQNPEASDVRTEQWPYQVARITAVDGPDKRWPAIAVDAALPIGDPIRAGQAVFVVQCMACHTLNGAGTATKGPDLNQPMNPTEYLTETALRQLVRDPAALRSWPAMQMKPMPVSALSDHELDEVVVYLKHMAARRPAR